MFKFCSFKYIALLAISIGCYLATFAFSGILFMWFNPSGHDCGLNVFVIVMTMVLAFSFGIIALHPAVNGSLLPASAISVYCAYVCYTGLSSEPRDYVCNGLHNKASAVSLSTLILGMLTTVLSVIYSALRAGSSTTFLSPPSSPKAGGAIVGTVVGAMKGQTTETGFFRGAGIGAVAGAITAVQLLESLADGESLSKVALLVSLVNGKVFIEWVSPAVLKAYQWQMNSLESTYREISDIYDVNGGKGLSRSCIQKLPMQEFHSIERIKSREESYCSICIQGLKDGEMARNLPRCGHIFHLKCIDEWLSRQGTCPMCREHVLDDDDNGGGGGEEV